MEELGGCIENTLRKGDVVTQYSANQFLLLLPAPGPDKAQLALDRILSRFAELYPRCPLLLRTSTRAVDPVLS